MLSCDRQHTFSCLRFELSTTDKYKRRFSLYVSTTKRTQTRVISQKLIHYLQELGSSLTSYLNVSYTFVLPTLRSHDDSFSKPPPPVAKLTLRLNKTRVKIEVVVDNGSTYETLKLPLNFPRHTQQHLLLSLVDGLDSSFTQPTKSFLVLVSRGQVTRTVRWLQLPVRGCWRLEWNMSSIKTNVKFCLALESTFTLRTRVPRNVSVPEGE